MLPAQRIEYLIQYLDLNAKSFSEAIGLKRPQAIYDVLNGKTKSITEQLAIKIISVFPEISKVWLLTGVGDSILSSVSVIPNHRFKSRTDHIVDSQEVPLYDFDAAAGLVAIFNDRHPIPADFLKIPNMPPVDGAVYVRGESMFPLLKSGDIVMYKKKELAMDSIIWGEIYLLSFISDGDTYTAVKYIQKSDQQDMVRLASFNPSFAPKDIPISSITALALVKASITFHTME